MPSLFITSYLLSSVAHRGFILYPWVPIIIINYKQTNHLVNAVRNTQNQDENGLLVSFYSCLIENILNAF